MEIRKFQLKPDLRQFYGIDAEDKIYLQIQIGNGQIGGSKVILDGKLLAKGNLSQPTLIGNSAKLLDKEIEIETNVLDVNHFTNMSVITTTLLNQDNKILFTKIDNGEAPDSGVASFQGKYKLLLLTWLIVVLGLLGVQPIRAQSTADKVTFQSLETPSSPGFILLDKAPSSIERPTTPQGFGFSMLSLLKGNGGAVEFAPFWLVNHPKLTAEQMYRNQTPILYNFSISAATLKNDTSSYFAGGIRTRLFQNYDQLTLGKLDSIKREIELALADLDTEHPDFTKIEKLLKSYTALIEKPIFTIDFAAALGGESASNSMDNLSFKRWSAWISYNWRPKGDDFYFTILTRLTNNEKFEDYSSKANLLDVGSRFNYDIDKFCLSLEYLQRFNLTKNNGNDYRIAVIGSYQLSDNFYLTTTFGKNFSQVNNIIAMAGINFGLSKSKLKAF